MGGRSGRAPDGRGSEPRRGEADGATLALHRYGKRSSKDTERRERGTHPGRLGCLFIVFICSDSGLLFIFLIRGEIEVSHARRSFVRRPDFWSFNLANWPPRQINSQTVSPPPSHPCCFGYTLRRHSLFMDSCLIYFFLSPVLDSPCVTSIHP